MPRRVHFLIFCISKASCLFPCYVCLFMLLKSLKWQNKTPLNFKDKFFAFLHPSRRKWAFLGKAHFSRLKAWTFGFGIYKNFWWQKKFKTAHVEDICHFLRLSWFWNFENINNFCINLLTFFYQSKIFV